MFFALPQPRPKHRPALRGLPMLLAMVLALLQVATPFAHAMLHVAAAPSVDVAQGAGSAQAAKVAPGQHSGAVWSSAAADEKPCALCAADHLPGLPEALSAATPASAARERPTPALLRARSSAPLDLFCRPPPAA